MAALRTTAGVLVVLSGLTVPPAPRPTGPDLTGVWKVALHEADGVELDFRMTFRMTGTQPPAWEAWSREDAVREAAGGLRAFAGSLLGKLPPHGAFISVSGGEAMVDGGVVLVSGALDSPFLGRRQLDGRLTNGVLTAALGRPGSGVVAGSIRAVRDSSAAPFRDYRTLADAFERTFRAKVFDPALLKRSDVQRFFKTLATRLAAARDDLDVIGAFQGLVESLPVSHVGLIRNPTLASKSLGDILNGDPATNPDTFVQLSLPAPFVAHLRVLRWDRVAPAITRAFEQIQRAGILVVILDIRGNPGGDHSSVAPLAHLFEQRVAIGILAGRKWYDAHATPPTSGAPGLATATNESTALDLLDALDRAGAVTAQSVPRPPYFAGKVYVLVDGRSGSASEPLTAILQATHRATVVGERTAGKMLMALPHALDDGWLATIPVADLVLPDGTRLEGRGVQPDIRTDEVFLAVADRIAPALPYSGARLRAGALEGLKRPLEAERAYRVAITLEDRQDPPPNAAMRATPHRRLALLLTARGDLAGARLEYAEVLKLLPNDAEALAALRGR